MLPSLFARIGEAFGRVEVLVASAAATAFRPLAEQKPHNVRLTFAICVDSFIAAVNAAVPLMAWSAGSRRGDLRHRQLSGHVGSWRARWSGGAKAFAAIESLVRAFALELGPVGITVNGANPGFIATDSSRLYLERGLGREYDAAVADLVAATPARRAGTVDDVAGCVAWMASDGAGFVTGQTVVLDGGLTIVSPMARLAAP